jgi:hypothetical protein
MGPPEIEPRSSYNLNKETCLLEYDYLSFEHVGNPRPVTQHHISHDLKPQKQGYKILTSHKSLNYFTLLSHRVFIKPKNTATCELLINWKKYIYWIFLQHSRKVKEVSAARKMQFSSSPVQLHDSFPMVLTSPTGHNTAGVIPKT